MNKKLFRKLFATLKERVEKEGKKSPAWFLGFVEGLGNRKLKGYQIGALVNLLLLPEDEIAADNNENVMLSNNGEIDH